MGSRLVGRLVEAEITGKTVESDSSKYLADIEGYHRDLIVADPYYALT